MDQHADTLENDSKHPLVLLGEEGSGKSALLANWLARRKEKKHKDEFLFQHYVGCSTPSLQLSHTLFRLETALKDFFQLREMKVPDSESDLRWSLNRFLAAAAKKHSPARIVIIIDCVHCLKAEGAADGALHWLPIDLPPCVRFIISTIENESSKGRFSDVDRVKHKTFVELSRRGYPTLKMEKITVPICNHIIGDYIKLSKGALELSEHQQFKIVTAPAAIENPMFLRSLLQSIRLIKSIAPSSSIDSLLESFLRCSTAYDLIDKCLNICQEHLVQAYSDYRFINKILGNMFSVVYASRNGLTESEIWGILRLVIKDYPEEELARKLFFIVKDFTMVVDRLHSFSHKIYREFVYTKYIENDDVLKKWHFSMARFFGELPPCPRKVVALPHHLKYAGAWTKVKNCLTDIDMFHYWWTPPFKKEFLKLWSSLTVCLQEDEQNVRPVYDLVEEYVKSLDEYRSKKNPKDEEVANIILEIGDFLIEFATLGHEERADVPSLFHPLIPSDDLKAIGVPYIKLETDGKHTYGALQYPVVFTALGPVDEKAVFDNPKAYDDLPVCSAYYFHRWMWIQFPFVALGSCDKRFVEGVSLANNNAGRMLSRSGPVGKTGGGLLGETSRSKVFLQNSRSAMSKSVTSLETSKLPQIKFVRKAARTVKRTQHNGNIDSGSAVLEAFYQRLESLKDEVQAYRDEHDFLAQIKTSKYQKLAELKGQMEALIRSGECSSQYDSELTLTMTREEEASRKAENIMQINRNLLSLFAICERHPPNVPALITEILFKLDQDLFVINEIKSRLWEQNFEMGSHYTTFRDARRLLQKGSEMRGQLIGQREEVKTDLELQQYKENHFTIKSKAAAKSGEKNLLHRSESPRKESSLKEDAAGLSTHTWAESWSCISSRTGILDANVFFQRFSNA